MSIHWKNIIKIKSNLNRQIAYEVVNDLLKWLVRTILEYELYVTTTK